MICEVFWAQIGHPVKAVLESVRDRGSQGSSAFERPVADRISL